MRQVYNCLFYLGIIISKQAKYSLKDVSLSQYESRSRKVYFS